jgi:hypothetical protein
VGIRALSSDVLQGRIIATTAAKSKAKKIGLFGFPNSTLALQRFIVGRKTSGMVLKIGFEKNGGKRQKGHGNNGVPVHKEQGENR